MRWPTPSTPRHRALLRRCPRPVLAFLLLLPTLAPAATESESLLGKPVVGKNADGHLEIFKVDADGELRHRWQKVSNGDWSSWNNLGGSCLPGIALANSTNGELLVFAVDSQDHTLKYIRQKAPNSLDWSEWTNLGGAVRPPLAVGQNTDGSLQVFAVDAATHSAKHIRQTPAQNTWSAWAELGGSVEPGLAVERNRDGRLELFGIEKNTKALAHCFQRQAGADDSWTEWLSLGGAVAPGFVVRPNALGRLEVFAVNPTNRLVQRIAQAAPGESLRWTNWVDFGEQTAEPGLAIGKSADGRLEVMAVDARDATLMHRWEILPNGADLWSDWASLGTTAQPYPAVTVNEDGDLEVFALDLKERTALNHRRQISSASAWVDWSRLEHPTFQYSSRTWQIDEGLPDNAVQAIAQTRDGYLWVGTRSGLARFDGLAFTSFKPESAPELSSASITALCADRAGALWIGTSSNGLYRLLNGSCAHYGPANRLAGDAINVVYERRDGSLWIGTATGLSRFANGQFTTYTRQQQLSSDVIRALFEDTDGNLWIATGAGLNRMRGKLMEAFDMPNGLPNDSVRCICQDRGGRIWIGSSNGMLWYGSYWGKFFAYNTRYGLSDPFVSAICEDREGNLWVGTYSGLNRFHQGRFLTELDNEGVPFDRVNVLFEDRESNLWVGSKEGLVRLMPKRFSTFTKRQGLPHNNVMSVLESRDGNLWIGTWGGGLARLKDDRVTAFASTNLSQTLVLALTEGSDGSLWLGADFDGGLTRLKNGIFTDYTWKDGLPRAPIRALHEDRTGRLWIGTGDGLSCFQAGGFTNYTVKQGLPNDVVRAISEDHAGNLWFGTEGGLSRWHQGRFTSFTTRDGLSDDTILSLYEDNEHVLWIGTARGGLNQMPLDSPNTKEESQPSDGTPNRQPSDFTHHASRITSYTTRQGLFSDEIFEILEDEQGWLWMSCSRGVFRVKKRDLHSLDHGNRDALVCLAYGKSDGMESPQCNGSGKPAGWKTSDGHLCFVTSKGIVTVDPDTVTINIAPPPVRIEALLADKKPLALPEPGLSGQDSSAKEFSLWAADSGPPKLEIPPGGGELEFRYTALTYQSPEDTRFKYKLESVNADWVDAGTRRTAYYNNVNPGTYQFRVLACNKDGAWNERGAEVVFVLHPHIWQTWWWRTALVLAVLGTTAGTVRYLTRKRLQRKLALLEQRHAIEKERGRIAKDIHDDLGSSLTRIMMLGERAEEQLQAHPEVENHIGKIVATARHTVRALDEIVWAVNPENDTLEGLVQYLSHYADELFENTPVSCRLEMPNQLPAFNLSAEVRHDLFLVVKEAFHNVLKHSRASQVRVQLTVADSRLALILQDNGCGFTPGAASTGRKGNGLRNMRKRIETIGGQLELASAPGQGTRINISLPLAGNRAPLAGASPGTERADSKL